MEIHPFEGCPHPCGNGECVGFYYQDFDEPRTAARTTIEAMRLCTGVSSGWELTAKGTVYPFRGRFQELGHKISSDLP